MGYAFIPLMASIGLGVHHVAVSAASPRSKWTVAALVAASLAIWRYVPQWLVVATILQSAISIYMIVYLKMQASLGR